MLSWRQGRIAVCSLVIGASGCAHRASWVRVLYETRVESAQVVRHGAAEAVALNVGPKGRCAIDPPLRVCASFDGYDLDLEVESDEAGLDTALSLEHEAPTLTNPAQETWPLVAIDAARLVEDVPFGVVPASSGVGLGTRRTRQRLWPGFLVHTKVAAYDALTRRRWRLVPEHALGGVWKSGIAPSTSKNGRTYVTLYPVDFAPVEAWGTAPAEALHACLAVAPEATWRVRARLDLVRGPVSETRRYEIAIRVEGTRVSSRGTEDMRGGIPEVALPAPSRACPDAEIVPL